MNTPISDETAKAILDEITEADRLKKLSNEDLIRECLVAGTDRDLRAQELMDRLLPGWDETDLGLGQGNVS